MAYYDKYKENIIRFVLLATVLSCLRGGEYYVEVKDKRYSIHPNFQENEIPQNL